MYSEDSFHYALENTRVILSPQRRIETFGQTNFRFYLITELMDRANEVRVRDGEMHAERPQILTTENLAQLLLEGFGEQAQAFAGVLKQHLDKFTVLKYGFRFRKTDIAENIVRDSVETVIDRVTAGVRDSGDSLSAVIHGVDDAWEVCLLKFTVDLIQQSAGGNLGDFRRRGLL